jgi:hypothetical protein
MVMAAPTLEIAAPARAVQPAVRRLAFEPYLASASLVVPLFALAAWTGFRIGLSDSVLSTIAASEQPLSVRSPGGIWAIALPLLWFALAYWRRDAPLWQAALVLLGATAAFLRAGNAWIDGLLLIAPLGAQLSALRPRLVFFYGAAALGVLVAAQTLWTSRPPVLPPAAIEAAQTTNDSGTVFADWRWATELQQDLPQQVLASGGLASESPRFWLDYVRIVQDHERWSTELQDLGADVVVLNPEQDALSQDVRASSHWHVLYDGADAFVAERVAS